MNGLLLCSKKSEIPYRIADSDIDIFSIEEMAYYLYNNVYFVDESFFRPDLLEYIEKQLGLKKIAQKLKYAMGHKIDFSELVMIIIMGSGYYDEMEIRTFEKELKAISSKSMLERMKARADMLYDKGRLAGARQVYENILGNQTYKKPGNDFYAEVYKGLGRINCRMFYFEDAILEFRKAYELKPDENILEQIIFVKLMQERNDGQEADLEKESELNEPLVLKCRQEFKDKMEQICLGSGYERLSKILTYDGRHNLDDYYENIQVVLDEWKEEYRNEIA